MTNNSNYMAEGQNNYLSDVSGFKYKSGRLVKGVDVQKGLVMDVSEASEYNPQFKLLARSDKRQVPDVRETPPYNFSAPPQPSDL